MEKKAREKLNVSSKLAGLRENHWGRQERTY
jgi:hypothetical protein